MDTIFQIQLLLDQKSYQLFHCIMVDRLPQKSPNGCLLHLIYQNWVPCPSPKESLLCEIMQYLCFCDWLISLSTMTSRPRHAAARDRTSLPLKAEQCPTNMLFLISFKKCGSQNFAPGSEFLYL